MTHVGEHGLLPLPPIQEADRSCSQSLSDLGIRTALSLSLKWLHGASVPPYHTLFPNCVSQWVPEHQSHVSCDCKEIMPVKWEVIFMSLQLWGKKLILYLLEVWSLPIWDLPGNRLVTPEAKCFLTVNRKTFWRQVYLHFGESWETMIVIQSKHVFYILNSNIELSLTRWKR